MKKTAVTHQEIPAVTAPRSNPAEERSIAQVIGELAFASLYPTRFQAMSTLQKLTGYDDYNLYQMDIAYPYDLESIIGHGIASDQDFADAIVAEVLPRLPVHFDMPSFGCSAFTLNTADGRVLMGRNYDFAANTSAMLVRCKPEGGYASIAFAALSNIEANDPQASPVKGATTLIAPFICLDGMNEKGVSIAVLTLDSEPVNQCTGKPKITTSLAIRLVLDRAATTQEAVDLLRGYDMLATCGKDYHFYITDASGDGRAVEYDCESEARELIDTPMPAITNFFARYLDRVQPNERNAYGHGKERYEAILQVFAGQDEGSCSGETAWKALRSAAQELAPGDLTSNTQWSIVYDDTNLTADCVIRRHWDDVTHFDLDGDAAQ